METAVVLFTRDLRVHDQPALAAAAREARSVLPWFVFDEAILRRGYTSPNRVAFLLDALFDLRTSLRRLGADLIVRRGDPVEEAVKAAQSVGATAMFMSDDVSAYAQARRRRLTVACGRAGIDLRITDGLTVVPPGAVSPAGHGHYRIFTPYWRGWRAAPWRPVSAPPRALRLPGRIAARPLPARRSLVPGAVSPALPIGGETEGRRAWRRWQRREAESYEARRDDPAGDATSRLSPYVHFGCLSSLELAYDARSRSEAFLRQLCWRDFFHQVTAAFPQLSHANYARPQRNTGGRDVQAWRDGFTGYPIVDAGMRQLQQEGWMHNRVRLVVASFLTKILGVDWRIGAAHFLHWLVDGDVANNSGNWQWVAGTGNDPRPNRLFNPLRQAARFDPDGDYVRSYVRELAHIDGGMVHTPWKLPDVERRALDYPGRIVEYEFAAAAFRAPR